MPQIRRERRLRHQDGRCRRHPGVGALAGTPRQHAGAQLQRSRHRPVARGEEGLLGSALPDAALAARARRTPSPSGRSPDSSPGRSPAPLTGPLNGALDGYLEGPRLPECRRRRDDPQRDRARLQRQSANRPGRRASARKDRLLPLPWARAAPRGRLPQIVLAYSPPAGYFPAYPSGGSSACRERTRT